jgi:hypothetical protein
MGDEEIVSDNIRAASAIYAAAIFEAVKAFAVADRLVELFMTGQLPIGRSRGDSSLYQYWRDARDRMTTGERRRLYARTLGFSDSGAGAGGSVDVDSNREFTALWLRFVATVSEFARQHLAGLSPGAPSGGKVPPAIGQQDVRVRARDLASNVSRHGKGAGVLAIAINEQLRPLIALLSDPEIQTAYGVRGVWRLVERVSSLDLGGSPSSALYRTVAERGAVVFAWLGSRTPEFWTNDADALDMRDLASQRRSDHPNTNPTDYDLVDACEQWLAVSGVADTGIEALVRPIDMHAMHDAVAVLFSKSAAFKQLSPAMQARVVRDTARVADYLATMESPEAFSELIAAVDFPEFVAQLIKGVFESIVDASVQQMDAYADLVAAVAASVDQFRDRGISDSQLLVHLCEVSPLLCDPLGASDANRLLRPLEPVARGAWRRLARSRQQLLATMVMMGINRIKKPAAAAPKSQATGPYRPSS